MSLSETIIGMLKENTGKIMTDSGGKDNRMWQRNQDKDFESEPRVTVEYHNGYLDHVTVSLYHFLKEVLDENEVSDAFNAKLDSIREEQKDDWDNCIDNLFECHEWLDTGGRELFGIDKLHKWDYTYNYENHFSQEFQNIVFTIGNNAYVMLQIHNGADARAGFTKFRCFLLKEYLHGVDVYGSIEIEGHHISVSNINTGYNIEVDEIEALEGLVDDVEEFEIEERHNPDFDFNPMYDTLYAYFD
jgi:hypothetical protein